ncbi:hypothetical protein WCP94_001161 [Bilophila wadsworthia]
MLVFPVVGGAGKRRHVFFWVLPCEKGKETFVSLPCVFLMRNRET